MKLSAYFTKTGHTAATFAAELSVTPEAVRMWMRGDRNPKFEHLMEIERLTKGEVCAHDFASGSWSWHSAARK